MSPGAQELAGQIRQCLEVALHYRIQAEQVSDPRLALTRGEHLGRAYGIQVALDLVGLLSMAESTSMLDRALREWNESNPVGSTGAPLSKEPADSLRQPPTLKEEPVTNIPDPFEAARRMIDVTFEAIAMKQAIDGLVERGVALRAESDTPPPVPSYVSGNDTPDAYWTLMRLPVEDPRQQYYWVPRAAAEMLKREILDRPLKRKRRWLGR